MKNYEKTALIKFTSIYFFSTAFFVILLGYLYYLQQENTVLQKYTMKMHQYTMKLKQSNFTHKQDGYDFNITDTNIFQYKLASKHDHYYKKTFPIYKGEQFIIITIQADIIDKELNKIKKFTILSQIILLLLFFSISLFLARLSLKPMNNTISHLDRFIKDLIHDLNTPATSILLNTKMLKKQVNDDSIEKKLDRIQKSADAISSLYENLEIVLKETLSKSTLDIFPILEEQKELFGYKYPTISINIENKPMIVETNEKALMRILDNILSNACKYSNDDSNIQISFDKNTLIIKDNGKGMLYPNKIFERSYSEDEKGHGIGMHIVQRLCNNLNIKITVNSTLHTGTTVALKFNR